jgi:serine/threonine protein kinase
MSDQTRKSKVTRPTVVIVDDNQNNLNLLCEMLPNGGFEPIAFLNPKEALEQVLWFTPDAIILDLYMPDLSGFEFLQQLHARSNAVSPPCLVLSGAGDEESITSCYEMGAVDFLRKPFGYGELMAKLKRILGRTKRPTNSAPTNAIPQRIGEYQVRSEIGRGGMGVIYEVSKVGQEKSLALKAITSQQLDNESLLRFRREIDILATLQHPNLAKIFDAGRDNAFYYYVMDHIDGFSLQQHLSLNGRMKPVEVAEILAVFGETLQYLHDHNIVHRDIKPSNVIRRRDGHYFLVDFGLAKCFVDTQLTLKSDVIGTPQYMAPEIIRGLPPDQRSDIYSLGILVLEMLLGQIVVEGENPYTIMLNITQGQIRYAQDIDSIPATLGAVIDKMLSMDPNSRYQNGGDLTKDILPIFEELQKT